LQDVADEWPDHPPIKQKPLLVRRAVEPVLGRHPDIKEDGVGIAAAALEAAVANR